MRAAISQGGAIVISSSLPVCLSLSSRYLDNWNMFRSVCTVTFVLITLLLGICLVVAMVMGEWHVVTIYRSGEEEVSIEGAHQAGTMIKK